MRRSSTAAGRQGPRPQSHRGAYRRAPPQVEAALPPRDRRLRTPSASRDPFEEELVLEEGHVVLMARIRRDRLSGLEESPAVPERPLLTRTAARHCRPWWAKCDRCRRTATSRRRGVQGAVGQVEACHLLLVGAGNAPGSDFAAIVDSAAVLAPRPARRTCTTDPRPLSTTAATRPESTSTKRCSTPSKCNDTGARALAGRQRRCGSPRFGHLDLGVGGSHPSWQWGVRTAVLNPRLAYLLPTSAMSS